MIDTPHLSKEEYYGALIEQLIEDHAEGYKPCKDCKLPTEKIYVCSHCGSDDP